MISNVENPPWDQIVYGCDLIHKKIRFQHVFVPDIILCIVRGGLIPGTILSNKFNVPLIPISYSSKEGRGNDVWYDNKLPLITGQLTSGLGELPPRPKLLIVDDICDSGRTLQEVSDHYVKQKHECKTATLYYKEGAIMTPDAYVLKLLPNSGWITFPWET